MSTSGVKRRAIARAVVGVVLVIALAYGVRVAWLFTAATEGDVPTSSAVPLPTGATFVSEEKACASGGCWMVLRVEPPEGQSADELAAALGATPQLQIAGNFLDPRTINVQAEPDGPVLELRIDYWSQKWVP